MRHIDIPRKVCVEMLGQHQKHRMVNGGVVMVTGVLLTHTVMVLVPEYHAVRLMADVLGYLLHGVGAIPFIEWIMKEPD